MEDRITEDTYGVHSMNHHRVKEYSKEKGGDVFVDIFTCPICGREERFTEWVEWDLVPSESKSHGIYQIPIKGDQYALHYMSPLYHTDQYEAVKEMIRVKSN